MSKGQRAIATLLAVIAVLLTLNLGRFTQAEAVGPTGPVPVGIAAHQYNAGGTGGGASDRTRVFRLWSDGSLDTTFIVHDAPGGIPGCEVASACTRAVPILPCPSADVTGDGVVNVLDLIELLLVFGMTCR